MTGNVRWLLILTLLLTGCAGIMPSADRVPPSTGIYQESIDIDGRLSVQYQQNGKDEALHGNFDWSQTPQRTVITLTSPLGQTLAVIEVTPDIATLTQNGRPRRMAADADTLTELALGWPLPITGLRDWLQGVATGANGRRFVASPQADSAATVATQDGWRIRYVSWQDTAGSPPSSHPKRIDLVRSTPQAGEVSVRLVIDKWQPH